MSKVGLPSGAGFDFIGPEACGDEFRDGRRQLRGTKHNQREEHRRDRARQCHTAGRLADARQLCAIKRARARAERDAERATSVDLRKALDDALATLEETRGSTRKITKADGPDAKALACALKV